MAWNQCVVAGCRRASDCPDGACGVSQGDCGVPSRLACIPGDAVPGDASGGSPEGLVPCAGHDTCAADELCVFLGAYGDWYCASTNSCGFQ